MCTVVVHWSRGGPTQILALRDELTSRDFDDPDAWWPEQPDVFGGRDRLARGPWGAGRVTAGGAGLGLHRGPCARPQPSAEAHRRSRCAEPRSASASRRTTSERLGGARGA